MFKGGTSLSKCYGIIDRFSEDVDLAVQFNSDKVTQGERKKLKKQLLEIVSLLGMFILNEADIRSRRDHNEYYIKYDNIFEASEEMVPNIIVETIVAYRPYPCDIMKVSNYITKYLEQTKRIDLVKKFDMTPFDFKIQTVERTFIDKIFAICDYHLSQKYHRYSRHLYDIHMIWTSNKMNREIMIKIIPFIIEDRQLFGTKNLSCQPGTKIIDVLREIIKLNVFKADYKDVTSKFIYKEVEYNTCIKTLEVIIDSGILPIIIQNSQLKVD